MSKNAHFGELDSEYAALWERIPHTEPATDVLVVRQRVQDGFVGARRRQFESLLPSPSLYEVKDHQVPVSASDTILVRTVVPVSATRTEFPCLVFAHGGGFTAGNVDFDDYPLRIISVELQVVVVNVDYRVAPENPFPAGVDDTYTALKWAVTNAQSLKVSPSKGLIIGGCSAGSNFAAVIAHRARSDPFFKATPLTGHVLQYPVVIHPDAYPPKYKDDLQSLFIEKNKEKAILRKQMVHDMYKHYASPPNNPEGSPLLYESHAGLAPIFLQVAGLDPLRDEGILYEKVLREAGVGTKMIIYKGVPHGFNIPFGHMEISKSFERDFKDGLRWLLDGAPHASQAV